MINDSFIFDQILILYSSILYFYYFIILLPYQLKTTHGNNEVSLWHQSQAYYIG